MEKETKNQQEPPAEAKVNAEESTKPKKTNRTWEAFGKSKGCFIINDPKFML